MRCSSSLLFAASALVLPGACVGPVSHPPAPAVAAARAPSTPVPVRAQAPAASPAPVEWLYRPVAPGAWTYQADNMGSAARFGAALTIRCDRAARRVAIMRGGTGQLAAGQGSMIVRTSFGAVTWPATLVPGAAPQMSAVRAAPDAALDQIAYSRGKFAVEVAGASPLIVPAWPEVARVIEDCRG